MDRTKTMDWIRRRLVWIAAMVLAVLILPLSGGCEEGAALPMLRITGKSDIYENYAARQIRLVGLTEIIPDPEHPGHSLLVAYVDLLDAFENKVKSPGTFRFEIYNFVPRSNEPRGKRLFLWADIDLVDAEKNNIYWQDFLRTYKFELEMDFLPGDGQQYIVEATFITPRQKRISDTIEVLYGALEE